MTSIRDAMTLARQHQQAGRLQVAEQIYRQIVEQQPQHADAWHLLGLVNSQAGRHQAAVDYIRRAIEVNPHAAVFWHNLALVYQALNRLDDAIACHQRALELQPNYAAALSNLGTALRLQGRLDEAVAAHRQALALLPDDAWTHCNLGIALRMQGQLDEAVACYRRALELDASLAEAHNNLANVLQDQGKTAAAVAAYRRALELRPGCAEMYKNLGLALQELGQRGEAITCYRHVLELQPDDAEMYKNLGLALEEDGQLHAAMACYRRVLDLKPDSADGKVHHSLGLEYLRMGCFAEAAEVWQHWLQTDPQAPVARHMVAAATEQDVPARASDDYVRSTFETFAPTFDQQLQELDYRVPAMTAAAVAKAFGEPAGNLDVLDAGCGTGLCGPWLRPYARRLTGVDLSPAMLQRAQARQVYDALVTGELTAHLRGVGERYDLIVAADTLVYFGDLRPVLAAAAQALRSAGLLVFSLEQDCREDAPQQAFRLQPHGRYCHAADTAVRTLVKVGLCVHEVTLGILRTELGQGVAGMVVVAGRR